MCNEPITIVQGKEEIQVPCGRCFECKKRKSNDWTFRIQQEHKNAFSAAFVTLTYDPMFVPATKSSLKTLVKKDVQDYIKRLRRRQERYCEEQGFETAPQIRYYACGEYGSQTYRPHYHLIIFNVLEMQHCTDSWQKWVYTVNEKKELLPIGYVDVQVPQEGALRYVAKYLMKPHKIPRWKGDDRLPEFHIMSKGFGAQYLTPEMIQWHKKDLNRNYCALKGNIKIALPRYYRDRIYNATEKEQQNNLIDSIVQENYLDYMVKVEKIGDDPIRHKQQLINHQRKQLQRESDKRNKI